MEWAKLEQTGEQRVQMGRGNGWEKKWVWAEMEKQVRKEREKEEHKIRFSGRRRSSRRRE